MQELEKIRISGLWKGKCLLCGYAIEGSPSFVEKALDEHIAKKHPDIKSTWESVSLTEMKLVREGLIHQS